MSDNHIQELLSRIQTLSSDQLRAIQDAMYLGMSAKVARECEERRETIAALVDALAGLCG